MEVRKWIYLASGALLAGCAAAAALWVLRDEAAGERRHARDEMEILIANPARIPVRLFRAGEELSAAREIGGPIVSRISLAPGNYFIRAAHFTGDLFYPVPVLGDNAGPERDGSLLVTVRSPPEQRPPIIESASPFVFIPSGHFLMGDRASPREIHYVWVTGFFMAQFEVTNAEFRLFLDEGYANDHNWTEEGRRWRVSHATASTAALRPHDKNTAGSENPATPS